MWARLRDTFAVRLLSATIREWSTDRAGRMAAALTYYALLALAPLALVAVAMAGALFGADAASGTLVIQIRQIVGGDLAETVQELVAEAGRASAPAGLIGLVLAFLAASGLMRQIQVVLADVFGVAQRPEAGFIDSLKQRLVAFIAAVGLGMLLALLTAANSAFSFVDQVLPRLTLLVRIGGPIVSLLTLVVVFGLLFRFLSEAVLPKRALLRGAGVTAALFVVGAVAVGFFLSRPGVGSATGLAASLVVLLVFTYYQVQIFLFGAEVTKVYARFLSSGSFAPNP